MRLIYLIFICLMLVSIPATSKMFDLGEYTVDTGAYSPPHNAGVTKPGTLEWSWNDKKRTSIILLPEPEMASAPKLNNISDKDIINIVLRINLLTALGGMDGIDVNVSDYENFSRYWRTVNAVVVDTPYPGYMAISSRRPTVKIYAGAIDRSNFILIFSSESNEMLALIMRELKVYPKEESGTARLQAIKSML